MQAQYKLKDVLSMMGGKYFQDPDEPFYPVSYAMLVGYSLMIPNSSILVHIARDRLAALFLGRILKTVENIPWLKRYRVLAYACAHEMADHYVDQIIERRELASDEVKTYTTMIDKALLISGSRFAAQLSSDPDRWKQCWREFHISHVDEDTPTLMAWYNRPLASLSQTRCSAVA